jgi:hypothetical protein
MLDVEELRATLAGCFTEAGYEPTSATIYMVRADDPEPDVDVLIVYDGLPDGYTPMQRFTGRLAKQVACPVNATFWSLSAVREELRTPGSLLTEIVHLGLHIAGTPLPDLVEDAAPYDPDEVRRTAHAETQRWIARIRHRQFAQSTGNYLALVLETCANAALGHHRQGTLAEFNGALTRRRLRRLAAITSDQTARETEHLILALRARADADCSEYSADLQRLADILLVAALDPDAPGCTIV